MRIITCASYYATGSSAVTDLFSEFQNCSSVGDHEFRFIHDPDGIRDLEYNLIENNNRHNTSNAIKRYLRFAKQFNGGIIRKGYKRYMGDTFMKYTKEYIDSITELQCESWWYYDRIERGHFFYLIDTIISNLFYKIFKRKGITLLNLLHEEAYFSAIDKETFYKYTIDYIEKVISSMNRTGSEFVMVDQLLPPSNLDSYLNYFNDIKVIVVDRDPRDIFILGNEEYREKIIPYKNVQNYCQWYEIIRRHRKKETYDNDKVFFLNFEDLIYRYEEMSAKLIEFVGLDKKNHISPKSCFDPAVSINNTNLKIKFKKYKMEMEYIEEHLKEYLYKFPSEC